MLGFSFSAYLLWLDAPRPAVCVASYHFISCFARASEAGVGPSLSNPPAYDDLYAAVDSTLTAGNGGLRPRLCRL